MKLCHTNIVICYEVSASESEVMRSESDLSWDAVPSLPRIYNVSTEPPDRCYEVGQLTARTHYKVFPHSISFVPIS